MVSGRTFAGGGARLRAILIWFWYAVLFAGGVGLIWSATVWGVGVRVDSLEYLSAAESLSRGQCLCWLGSGGELKPLVHFPPLYPSLVAAVSMMSRSIREAARVVDAGLYGANLVLWGLAVHALTRRFWAGALVSGLLLASPVLLRVHDAAMSEPLFLLALVSAFAALSVHLSQGRRGFLLLAALGASAALLTRYSGTSVVIASAVALLLLGRGPLPQRVRESLVFAGVSFLPLGLWLIRNFSQAGSATNRTLRFHPVDVDHARLFLDIVRSWFTAIEFSHWLEGAGLLLVLGGAGLFLWWAKRSAVGGPSAGATFGLIFLVFAVVYPGVIAVSRSFFDDTIPIDDRMMAPLFLSLAVMAGTVTAIASPSRRGQWVLISLWILFGLGPGLFMVSQSKLLYERLHTEGVGYASQAWNRSGSLSWVRTLPAQGLIYSNRAFAIQFLTHHWAHQLPERHDAVKAEPRSDFAENLARMRAALQQPGSYLLIFDPTRPIDPGAIAEDFTNGLVPVLTTSDGIVFARPAGTAEEGRDRQAMAVESPLVSEE